MKQVASEDQPYLPTNDHDRQQSSEEEFERIQALPHQTGKRGIIIPSCIIFFLACLFISLLINRSSPLNQINGQSLTTGQAITNSKENIQQSNIKGKTYLSINISETSFNLWDITKEQKLQLLHNYEQYRLAKGHQGNPNHMDILSNIDLQASKYINEFEEHSEEVKWSESLISQQQELIYQKQFNQLVIARNKEIQNWIKKYSDYQFNESLVSSTRNITKAQFFKAIAYHKIIGKGQFNEQINKLYEQQKSQLQNKYGLQNYSKQLKACVIVPTFNNAGHNRYLWNLQSILQQEYDNFKVIIVDDASSDNTTGKIAEHLRWRKADPNRYVLIKSKKRTKSLSTFYYGAHKYCGLGEIIYTIDGDDELIGTQVFKLVNAIYQSQKPYTLYSIFIVNYPANLTLANNHEYSLQIKKQNGYRWDKSHGYSHLRTMLSDTFLLVNSSSFKSENGHFFELITDNAVYFCAMELSCQKVKFLQELNYWYHYDTENNIFNQMSYKQYQTFVTAVEKKTPYRCIHDYFIEAQKWRKESA